MTGCLASNKSRSLRAIVHGSVIFPYMMEVNGCLGKTKKANDLGFFTKNKPT